MKKRMGIRDSFRDLIFYYLKGLKIWKIRVSFVLEKQRQTLKWHRSLVMQKEAKKMKKQNISADVSWFGVTATDHYISISKLRVRLLECSLLNGRKYWYV